MNTAPFSPPTAAQSPSGACRVNRAHTLAAGVGFTMIELLVVVGIILVLTALLIPAVKRMINQSGRGKAAAQVVALANGAKAYRTTYGTWPGQTQGAKDNDVSPDKILHALTNNPRRISFIEPKDNWVRGGYLVDPWGRIINVAMDENGDGKVSVGIDNAPTWTAYSVDENGVRSPASAATFAATNVTTVSVMAMSWGSDPANRNHWVLSWLR